MSLKLFFQLCKVKQFLIELLVPKLSHKYPIVVIVGQWKDCLLAAWQMNGKGRKVGRDGSRKQVRPRERYLSLRLAGVMGRGAESGFKSYHSGVELIGLESERNKGEGGAYDVLGFLFAFSVDGGPEPWSPNWKREGSKKGVVVDTCFIL